MNWNNHNIRRQINSSNLDRPPGRPNILYFMPGYVALSIRDYKYNVDPLEYSVVEAICCSPIQEEYICKRDFLELAYILMHENNLQMPKDATEALLLFETLKTYIDAI